MLDLETFTYLHRALESTISPIVILASNRGLVTIRGTTNPSAPNDPGLIAAHGIPPDLLPRLLIVPTLPYDRANIQAIIQSRAKLEFATPQAPSLSEGSGAAQGLKVSARLQQEALEELTMLGESVSLRYALQLLSPASILARARGSEGGAIGVEDIREARALFWDAGRSAERFGAESGAFIS